MFGKKKDVVAVDGENQANKFKQAKVLGLIFLAAGLLFFVFHLLTSTGKVEVTEAKKAGAVQRIVDASSRNPSDNESFENLSSQVQGQAGVIDEFRTEVKGLSSDFNSLIEEIRELKSENKADTSIDHEVVFLRDELAKLKKQIKELPDASNVPSGSARRRSAVGEGGLGNSLPPRTRGVIDGSDPRYDDFRDVEVREVVVLDLGGEDFEETVLEDVEKDISGNLSDAVEPDVFATKDYVPPNAFAPATVLVGVDAATGQRAQNDPLNATFLITGPARHVVKNGLMETTDLEGCIVNGAAFGDLSSERVFIKLVKMTCPLGNGKVSVQDVQGHVTENGKAGVRGQIISRVGDKINRAAIAGLFSGLGGALGNAGTGSRIGSGNGIIQEIPSGEELAIASVGSGVSNAANTLTEYYVERARAIEPVVSMPRGIDIELVFINGFKPRPTVSED